MHEFSIPLGNVIKVARERLGFTQKELAENINSDVRTILNIENYRGNPKLEVLYPLIRALRIDSREIFYPEMQRNTASLTRLRLLIEECGEDEADRLIPIVQASLAALRADKPGTKIK